MSKNLRKKSEHEKTEEVAPPKVVIKKVAPKKVISKLPIEIGASIFDLRTATSNVILKINELIDHANTSK